MTKSIEQDESFFRQLVSFKKYSSQSYCFNNRFEGFIPDNFTWKIVIIPSSSLRNFIWNRPVHETETIGSTGRIQRLQYGYNIEDFDGVQLFKSYKDFDGVQLLKSYIFPPNQILHDKLRALDPSFVENTDDYTKRVFACESFSI